MEHNIDKNNINNSHVNLNTSVSETKSVCDVYNVTPIVSQECNLEDNVQTQSLITLTEATSSNSNLSSRLSLNLNVFSSENALIKSIPEFLKDADENIYKHEFTSQPQILFNAPPKRCKKLRRKRQISIKQKYKKFTHLARPRIVHFKFKHPERKIKRKLEFFCNKTKINSNNLRQMQQELRSDSVLKNVSRSRILKKVLAKADLFDECDKTFSKDINQDRTLNIETSNFTLTGINSKLSQNDSINTKSVTSVIEIPNKVPAVELVSTCTLIQTQSRTTELIDPPYKSMSSNKLNPTEIYPINISKESREAIFKTDIISVAVAQIDDKSIFKYKTHINSDQSQEEMLYKENLTSTETFSTLTDALEITSSLDMSQKYLQNDHVIPKDDDKNCVVLTDMVNRFDKDSSSDTFVIAKTSSYCKDNSDLSDLSSSQTLTPSSELANQTKPCNIYYQSAPEAERIKSTLLDTIINVGMYQMPQNCSENQYNSENFNNVIISEDLRKIPIVRKEQTTDKYSNNIIQKQISVDDEGDRRKYFNLPNEDTIRSIVTETEKTDKKSCSEEFRNFTPPIEMWDRLLLYFDVAIKRMEDALLVKISNELKETLAKYEKYCPYRPVEERYLLQSKNEKLNIRTKESDLCKMESGYVTHLDEGLQCCLVHNNIIDELTSKMKVERDTAAVEDFPLKLLKSKVKIKTITDAFEVLKSPIGPCSSTGKGKGDSLLTSTSESIRIEKLSSNRLTRSVMLCLLVPIEFLKTNMLVIASVPAFFVSIFLLYKFFVLLM